MMLSVDPAATGLKRCCSVADDIVIVSLNDRFLHGLKFIKNSPPFNPAYPVFSLPQMG